MKNKVLIPQEGQRTLRVLINNVQMAQSVFQNYAQGLKDGLSLDGDWNLDVNTMAFIKTKKETK